MLKKYDSARQATDYITTRRVRFACYITKATDTHPEYVILISFHCSSCYISSPHRYDIPSSPLFFQFYLSIHLLRSLHFSLFMPMWLLQFVIHYVSVVYFTTHPVPDITEGNDSRLIVVWFNFNF